MMIKDWRNTLARRKAELFEFVPHTEEEAEWAPAINNSIRIDRADHVNGKEPVPNSYLQERMRDSRSARERLTCEMVLKARVHEGRTRPLIEIKGPIYEFCDDKMRAQEVESINFSIVNDRISAMSGSLNIWPDSIYQTLTTKPDITEFDRVQAREILKARKAEGRCIEDPEIFEGWTRD